MTASAFFLILFTLWAIVDTVITAREVVLGPKPLAGWPILTDYLCAAICLGSWLWPPINHMWTFSAFLFSFLAVAGTWFYFFPLRVRVSREAPSAVTSDDSAQ